VAHDRPAFRRGNALIQSQSCQLEIRLFPLHQIRKLRQIQADGKLSIQKLQIVRNQIGFPNA